MDILIALVVCLAAKIALWNCKKVKNRRKRKREPWPALLFGNWYYWYKANRATR